MSAPIITDGLGPCDTTDASEQCFQHIQHLRSSIRNNPSWYPCLTGDSTLEELQFYLYSSGFGSHCSVPCQIDSRRACTASSQFSWAGALEVSPLTLQFDGQNWDQPQTILVWARDDQVDLGDEYSFRLTHTTRSDDTAYHGIAELVTVTVRDDDTAGVNLSPVENSAAATEGGTNFSFQVTLLSQPLDAVQLRSRVQLADHSISTLARVNPEIIRIPVHAWQTAFNVTVAVARGDDDVAEAESTVAVVYSSIESADRYYKQLATTPHVSVLLRDNDWAGIVVPGAPLNLTESGSHNDSYPVHLASRPNFPVLVSVHFARGVNDETLRVTPATLLFDQTNYDHPQRVTVSAVDDHIDQGYAYTIEIWHFVASEDPMYNSAFSRLGELTAIVGDDDIAGVLVSRPSEVFIYEHATMTGDPELPLFMHLGSVAEQMSLEIAIKSCAALGMNLVTACMAAESRIAIATIGAPSGVRIVQGWNCTNVTPEHSSRAIVGEQLRSLGTRSNSNGGGLLWPLCFGGLNVSVIGPGTSINAVYSIALQSTPLDNVIVKPTYGDEIRVQPEQIVIAPGTWNLPHFIIVEAIDDFMAEGPLGELHSIHHSVASFDPTYSNILVADLNATVIDNDAFSIDLSVSSLSFVESETENKQFEVVLGSQPAANVTIGIVVWPPSFTGDITLTDTGGREVQSLEFTSRNWRDPQRLNARPVQDCIVEAIAHFHIILEIADLIVEGRKVTKNVSVAISDDDVLPLPSAFAMLGPFTGPQMGGTAIMLTPVVQLTAVYAANLAHGAEVLCRFTDGYGQALSTTGSVLPRGGIDLACSSPSFADILCPSPPRELYADAALTCTVEVSVGGQPWVLADSSFLIFRWNTAELRVNTLTGPAYGNTSVTIAGVPAFAGVLKPRCKFGGMVVSAVSAGSDNSWTCTSPDVSAALGEGGQRASSDPCDYTYNTSVFLDLNGQQFLDLGVSFVWFGSEAPCTYDSLMPNSGPFTGGTLISVLLTAFPPVTFGAEWKCKFQSSTSMFSTTAVIVSAVLLTTLQGGFPYLRCESPAVFALLSTDTDTAPFTVAISLNGQQFSSRTHEYFYYKTPTLETIESSTADAAIWPLISLPTGDTTAMVILRGSIAPSQTAFIRLQPNFDTANADGWVTLPGWRAEAGDTVSFEVAAPRIGDNAVLISLNGQQYTDSGLVISFYDKDKPPVVLSARPASGSKDGGVIVRLVGDNLAGVGSLTCKFGSKLVPAAFVSTRAATCIAPPNGPVGATVSGIATLSIANFPATGLWSDQGDMSINFRYTETSPAQCTASGPGLAPIGLIAGAGASFTIRARTRVTTRDSGGDQFYVDLVHMASGDQITGRVLDLDREFYEGAVTLTGLYDAPSIEFGGTYIATWNATKAGIYAVEVTTSGTNISGSPFSVVVEPAQLWPPMASLGMTMDTKSGPRSGSPFSIVMRLRDVWGNAVMRPLDVSTSCWLARANVTIPLASTDARGRGGVVCTGSVQDAGLWEVAGQVDDHLITPIPIYIAPGPCVASASLVTFHCSPNGTV